MFRASRRLIFVGEDFARDFRDFLQTAPQQVDLVSCQHPGSRCDTEPPIESGNRRRSRNGSTPTFRGLSRDVGRVHGTASLLVHPRASLSAGSGVYNPHCGSVCRLKMIPRPFRLPLALRPFDPSTRSRHRGLTNRARGAASSETEGGSRDVTPSPHPPCQGATAGPVGRTLTLALSQRERGFCSLSFDPSMRSGHRRLRDRGDG